MPDIHDLLEGGAGRPIAALDMDAVLARSKERTRNRRIAQTVVGGGVAVAVVATSLFLAGGTGGHKASVTPLTTGHPSPVASRAPTVDKASAPPPLTVSDGTDLGIIHTIDTTPLIVDNATDAYGVLTYDKVDALPTTCPQAVAVTPQKAFSLCFSNTNDRLRQVPLAKDVVILRANDGNPDSQITPAQLQSYLPTDSGPAPRGLRVWKITIVHGVVTQLEQDVVGGT